MDWPLYYKDRLWLGNLNSNVGVATLWTPKEKIAEKLDKHKVAVVGQLYSKRGINFIIRNILANPKICYLIICGADRMESGDALLKLFKNGVNEKYEIVDADKAVIDEEIDAEALKLFREKVKVIDLIGTREAKTVEKEVKKLKQNQKPFAKLQTFPVSSLKQTSKFPSEKIHFNVRANYVWEAWIQILRKLMKFGSQKKMIHGGKVKELVNITVTLTEEDALKPKLARDFDFTKKDLREYYKDFLNLSRGSEDYNYGERIFNYEVLPADLREKIKNKELIEEIGFKKRDVLSGLDQFDIIARKLKRWKDDRGLVIPLWNPVRDNRTKEMPMKLREIVPCMILLQFTYRNRRLHLTAYFRSNDMFGGWPKNAFGLRYLQAKLAKKLKKRIGYLTTISNCTHIYESDWNVAGKLIEKHKDKTFCLPDPRGSVVIEVEKGEIVAKHVSPDGSEVLEEFRVDGAKPKAALKMSNLLIANDVISQIPHSFDIGIELSKAEIAVKEGRKFIQDKGWKSFTGLM